jgi:hypothetical protein
MGIQGNVSRNNLAHSNETRDWRIYADFAQILISKARDLYAGEDLGIELDSNIYWAMHLTQVATRYSIVGYGTVPADNHGI